MSVKEHPAFPPPFHPEKGWLNDPNGLSYFGGQYHIFFSICPNHSEHYFEVMYGSFDGRSFHAEITSHFQKGPDEYAGQIFHAPDGRNILISWIPGWDYQPKEKCIGCLSLPLELTAADGKIKAYPIKEVQSLVDENGTVTDAYVKEEDASHGEEVRIRLIKE